MDSRNRNQLISKLKSDLYDLVIIGGGVTGAGIALDAISRGLKVALIEKGDFASGTSSKSTKLIHGGLRYLKQFDFKLVRETGSERAIVHRLAPHLVIPEKMLLPLIKGGSYGRLMTSIGLSIYDYLAKVKSPDRRVMLSKDETVSKEPLLKDALLRGAGYYAEYRTDDARLTIELIKKSLSLGAHCINYVRMRDLNFIEGQIRSIYCQDELTGEGILIASKCFVSAAGPWVDEIRAQDGSLTGKQLRLTKGVHIVLDRHKLPLKQTVYFDVSGGRMIFAIPRQKVTYIGTTDTDYSGDLNKVEVSKSDAMYLLEAVNATFKNLHLECADIQSSWAGLRPLIHEESKSASQVSRKDEIFESPSGLLSIAGGKLTGYRKMAERIVDLVMMKLKGQKGNCITDGILLTPNPIENSQLLISYKKTIDSQLKEWGIQDDYLSEYFVTNYGSQTSDIFSKIENVSDINNNLVIAEINFCVKHEIVQKATDYLIRRTGLMYFDIEKAKKIYPLVLKTLAEILGWDQKRLEAEKSEVEQAFINLKIRDCT